LAEQNATYCHVSTGSQTTDKAAQLTALGTNNALTGLSKAIHAIAHPKLAAANMIVNSGQKAISAQQRQAATAAAPLLVSTDVYSVLHRLVAEHARREAAAQTAARLAPRAVGLLGDVFGSYGRPGDVR